MKILKNHPIDGQHLKSIVDISIGYMNGLIIKGIKVFYKDGERWINFPGNEYEKDGQKKFGSYINFEDFSDLQKFRNQFFKVYDEYIRKESTNQFASKDTKKKIDEETLDFLKQLDAPAPIPIHDPLPF